MSLVIGCVTMGELDSERFLRDYESYLETFCKTQEVLGNE